MRKTIFAAFLVLFLMIGTAIHAVHEENSKDPGNRIWRTQTNLSSIGRSYTDRKAYTGSIAETPSPKVTTSGEDEGWEANPFAIVAGLTLILCGAFGFWKYHEIHQDRKDAADATAAAAKKSTHKSSRKGTQS